MGPDAPTVSFFPMRPEPKMQVSWMLRALRMRIALAPEKGQVTIAWNTGTLFDESARARLPAGAINGTCLDVSKSRIDETWESVSGYSIRVDPYVHEGLMVVKSEENGAHDGRLITGPVRPRPRLVYQLFVDTRSGGRAYGTRPVIIGPEIAAVLDFWSAETDLFHGPSHCTVKRPADVFSDLEQRQILEFSRRIGLDFGELDVVRDRQTGRIFVIDANRTSFRPALLTRAGLRDSYRAMVPALRRLLESRAS